MTDKQTGDDIPLGDLFSRIKSFQRRQVCSGITARPGQLTTTL